MQAAPGLGAGGMMNGMNGMNGMMPGGMPDQGMGMGMGIQPGMMGQMGQMGIGGMGMGQIGGMGMMQPGMMGLQQGVPPHGSIGESQAAPVSHRHCHLFPLSSILREAYNEKKNSIPVYILILKIPNVHRECTRTTTARNQASHGVINRLTKWGIQHSWGGHKGVGMGTASQGICD